MQPDTQVIERQRATAQKKAHGLAADLQPATLTALMQGGRSGYSREFVRGQVLGWAARRWPEFFVGRDARKLEFESSSERSHVKVTNPSSGSFTWSFKGIRPDVTGTRQWETRVLVLGGKEHDLLGVSTRYAGGGGAAVHVAQPAFLNGLIEHLPFEDGGYPVCTVPRQVFDEPAFVNLQDHLLSRRRQLPVLVVGSTPSSSESRGWEEPRRINALSLAQQLCGLAHVVCIGPLVAPRLEGCLGSEMAVQAGEARLYLPGLDESHEQPSRAPQASAEATHFVAGDIGAAAQSATHAWSVSASRRMDFDSLWSAAVGA